jgi:hypothetical protein
MGYRLILFFLVTTVVAALVAPSASSMRRLPLQARQGTPPASYVGAGSCTSSNCHGAVWPKTGGKINQNEYNLWLSRDSHSKAYAVLLEPRSKQMARNLKIDKPETAAICLDCHVTNVGANQRAGSFDISDGVGCESCHGPSSAWLGPHTARDWSHEQSVRLGMIDTKDVKTRMEVCLSCHLGTDTKNVRHELIAAGHPVLIFELETFNALMPVHWRKENEKMDVLRRWAIAQALALRESMKEMQRVSATTSESWPDFAEFECMSCHHPLVLPSRRQERGYTGRAGLPPWNETHYVVLRQVLGMVSPASQRDMEQQVSQLRKSLESPVKDRAGTAAAAQAIAKLADQAVTMIERSGLDQQAATATLRNITSDATNIARAGMRAAEQATMSVDVLYNAVRPGRPDDPVQMQIGRLYEMLQSQAQYNPDEFATALARIGTLLQAP